MTNSTLAGYSNLALYSTLVVLALALVSYAIDLAHARQWADDAGSGADEAVPAGAADAAADAERGTAALSSAGGAGLGAAREAGEPSRAASVVAVASGGPDGTDAAGQPPGTPPGAPARRQWAGTGFALTVLAELLLVAAIALRGASVHRPPLGNMYEFSMVGAAFMLGAYLIWAARRDVRWLGLFVTGPVLITLGVAITRFYTEALQLMPSLKSVWLVIHVTIATLSTALFGIGAVLTVLYLLRLRREARPEEALPRWRAWVDALPGSRTLDRYAYGMHIIAFPLWTFTVIAGAIWAEQAWGRYWGWDPKEVWSFVIWVVYAAYLHARATSGWNARRAAWLALAGMLCLILNFAVVNVFFVGKHSYSGM